jgi:signal peptidase I
MEPTYHTGDLVISHRQSSYAVGDVVAYEVPGGDVGAGLTVIHRIIGGSPTTGFITQGDNNPEPDDWRPKVADVEGKAWMVVPKGGRILTFLHAPIPLAGLAAAVVVMWIVYQEETPSLRRRRG